jgi:hypothetical protein
MPRASKRASAQKFQVITNSQYAPSRSAALKVFRLDANPQVESGYDWRINRDLDAMLDDQAKRGINSAIRNLLDVIEDAAERHARTRLKLVQSAAVQ